MEATKKQVEKITDRLDDQIDIYATYEERFAAVMIMADRPTCRTSLRDLCQFVGMTRVQAEVALQRRGQVLKRRSTAPIQKVEPWRCNCGLLLETPICYRCRDDNLVK